MQNQRPCRHNTPTSRMCSKQSVKPQLLCNHHNLQIDISTERQCVYAKNPFGVSHQTNTCPTTLLVGTPNQTQQMGRSQHRTWVVLNTRHCPCSVGTPWQSWPNEPRTYALFTADSRVHASTEDTSMPQSAVGRRLRGETFHPGASHTPLQCVCVCRKHNLQRPE